jgi:hypothetical protein
VLPWYAIGIPVGFELQVMLLGGANGTHVLFGSCTVVCYICFALFVAHLKDAFRMCAMLLHVNRLKLLLGAALLTHPGRLYLCAYLAVWVNGGQLHTTTRMFHGSCSLTLSVAPRQ